MPTPIFDVQLSRETSYRRGRVDGKRRAAYDRERHRGGGQSASCSHGHKFRRFLVSWIRKHFVKPEAIGHGGYLRCVILGSICAQSMKLKDVQGPALG